MNSGKYGKISEKRSTECICGSISRRAAKPSQRPTYHSKCVGTTKIKGVKNAKKNDDLYKKRCCKS